MNLAAWGLKGCPPAVKPRDPEATPPPFSSFRSGREFTGCWEGGDAGSESYKKKRRSWGAVSPHFHPS